MGTDGFGGLKARKSGSMAEIPYVRVWAGDVARSEHCQHKCLSIYYKEPEGGDDG